MSEEEQCQNCYFEDTAYNNIDLHIENEIVKKEIVEILKEIDQHKISPVNNTKQKLAVLHCIECNSVMKHFKTSFDHTANDVFIMHRVHYIAKRVQGLDVNSVLVLVEKLAEDDISFAMRDAGRVQSFF